jgi:predicted house-cleaning noncanonical NTP pyrophosphatase (MazG superfamily)
MTPEKELELQKHLQTLYDFTSELHKSAQETEKYTTRRQAGDLALFKIVKQLAIRLGASEDSFLEHYEARYQRELATLLETVESVSSHLAAQFDERDVSDVPDPDEELPPLFLD